MKQKELRPGKSFYKMVLAMAIPITLQGLITVSVNLADTLMIGLLGETELSGVSLANQFISIFHTFCMGISMGAAVLSARFWGMQDIPSLRKAVTIMARITIVMAMGFSLVTFFWPEGIMRIYTNEEAIVIEGAKYLKISAFAYIFHGLTCTFTNIMRSIRQVKLPLIASIATFFTNVIGNYILIFGKLGLPALGIHGAAIATLVSRVIEFAVIVGTFVTVDKSVGYRVKHLFLKCGDMIPEFIKISIPVLISDGLLAIGMSMTAMVIGRMGESFVAANAVMGVASQFLFNLSSGVCSSASVIVGNSLGEGKVKEVQSQGYTFFRLGAIIGAIAGVFTLIVTEPVIAIYKLTGETADITRALMAALSILIIVQTADSIMTKGVLRGGGDTKMLMFGDCFFLWAVAVPLGYFAGLVWGLPPFWVLICLRIDSFLKCIWCFLRLRSGKWIKKVSNLETELGT